VIDKERAGVKELGSKRDCTPINGGKIKGAETFSNAVQRGEGTWAEGHGQGGWVGIEGKLWKDYTYCLSRYGGGPPNEGVSKKRDGLKDVKKKDRVNSCHRISRKNHKVRRGGDAPGVSDHCKRWKKRFREIPIHGQKKRSPYKNVTKHCRKADGKPKEELPEGMTNNPKRTWGGTEGKENGGHKQSIGEWGGGGKK